MPNRSDAYHSNQNHERSIFQSLTLPDGTNVPVVLTVDANRSSHNSRRRRYPDHNLGKRTCPGDERGEVEPWVAVNPGNSSHLVGVYQQDRWSDGEVHRLMTAVSRDGGTT
jgi:hypothetical protein